MCTGPGPGRVCYIRGMTKSFHAFQKYFLHIPSLSEPSPGTLSTSVVLSFWVTFRSTLPPSFHSTHIGLNIFKTRSRVHGSQHICRHRRLGMYAVSRLIKVGLRARNEIRPIEMRG